MLFGASSKAARHSWAASSRRPRSMRSLARRACSTTRLGLCAPAGAATVITRTAIAATLCIRCCIIVALPGSVPRAEDGSLRVYGMAPRATVIPWGGGTGKPRPRGEKS